MVIKYGGWPWAEYEQSTFCSSGDEKFDYKKLKGMSLSKGRIRLRARERYDAVANSIFDNHDRYSNSSVQS